MRNGKACCVRVPARAVQDVILMSDSCDLCGYKNAELKGGGGVSDYGRRITLCVSEPDDLRRDVIKAETASVRPWRAQDFFFSSPSARTAGRGRH